MDLTEAFAPSQAGGATGTEEKTTDYFDFVVSPPGHVEAGDDEGFLSRGSSGAGGCRTSISFLSDSRLHDGFLKETNNNTLTALPPVSTITGSLGHLASQHGQRSRCDEAVAMDQSDYWVSDDAKEQTCSILLEDLNKYCWSTQSGVLDTGRRDTSLDDQLQQHHSHQQHPHQQHSHQPQQNQQTQQQHQQQQQEIEDRHNTDGAIYTLTVLNSEANSMDGLEGCCKSPGGTTGTDGWRPSNHLDLDAILNMESSVSIGADGGVTDGGATSEFDEQAAAAAAAAFVQVKSELGDNNNDWKLSDRNSLQEGESAAESLLRNALQGKLYPGPPARILQTELQPQQQPKEETMQPEELLLSQLDVDSAYKLKSIASEVVESYCNLEPAVCSVPGTTVMYTLDPASGSLGTITLPADLAQVGTVTVVTTAPPPQPPQPPTQADALLQDTRHGEQQVQPASTPATSSRPKPAKKYVRRSKANGGAAGANSSPGAGTAGANSSPGGAGSPGSGTGTTATPRKERSLHYCSICSKGFKDKYSVNVHIRTHTGEKPFACSLCGKSFRQKAHLAKHYQTHVTQKPGSVAAQASQQTPAQPAQSNGQAPSSPVANLADQIAVSADSQISS